MTTQVSKKLLAVIGAAGALVALPAMAYDYTYTDAHGSFYGLTIGADTDFNAATETRAVTLVVDGLGNDDPTRFLDAAAIKVASSVTGSLSSATPGSWAYVPGGTDSGGCSGTGGGFMCASGHEGLSTSPFTFTWSAVMGAGKLFNGVTSTISLKAVYNSGETGFYQVSVPMVPVPEPEAYGLALAGMLVVGFAMRRKT